MVKYIIENKYPNLFNSVLVEKERKVTSNYAVDEDNYLYNIYLGLKGDLTYNGEEWKIKKVIRDAIRSMGIKNYVGIYFENPSEDEIPT